MVKQESGVASDVKCNRLSFEALFGAQTALPQTMECLVLFVVKALKYTHDKFCLPPTQSSANEIAAAPRSSRKSFGQRRRNNNNGPSARQRDGVHESDGELESDGTSDLTSGLGALSLDTVTARKAARRFHTARRRMHDPYIRLHYYPLHRNIAFNYDTQTYGERFDGCLGSSANALPILQSELKIKADQAAIVPFGSAVRPCIICRAFLILCVLCVTQSISCMLCRLLIAI
jgi:hypothetical protein